MYYLSEINITKVWFLPAFYSTRVVLFCLHLPRSPSSHWFIVSACLNVLSVDPRARQTTHDISIHCSDQFLPPHPLFSSIKQHFLWNKYDKFKWTRNFIFRYVLSYEVFYFCPSSWTNSFIYFLSCYHN